MIEIKKTERYLIQPKALIGDAFESAYTRYAEEQPVTPPDFAMPLFTSISMVILIMMFILTAFHKGTSNPMTWYIFSGFCVFFMIRSLLKYFKQNKEYKNAAGKPSTIKTKRDHFFAFFTEDNGELPDVLPAGELLKNVSPYIGKQNDQIYNNALRELSETLTSINNPSLTLCKLVNPCGEIFDQPKRRMYFKAEGNKYTFFDTDWMNPKGEITCSNEDIVSFGEYSKYSGIPTSGKIRPDDIIVEIKDENNHIYFEFRQSSKQELKKALPSKTEKK